MPETSTGGMGPFRTKRAAIIAGVAAFVVIVLVAAVVVVAMSGDDDKAPPPTTRTSTTTTSTTPETAVLAPLTGLPLKDPGVVFRPALAVKIDNVDTGRDIARPQAGLVDADVVFEEIVEGGITRLVEVFQSTLPKRAGPVRSARTTDPILLSQLNRPLFAWSGGNPGVVGAVHRSPLRDFGFDAQTAAYARDPDRRAPHNLFLDPAKLYAAAPKDARPPNALFLFRTAKDPLPANALPVKGVSLDFSGPSSVPVTFTYEARCDCWLRTQKGTPHVDDEGHQVAPANVVVLFTTYAPSPADPRSPEAQTVGSGDAWVFTHGAIIGGRWNRPAADQPATLTDGAGAPILLTPGRTWVELPKPGGATSVP